MKVGYFVSSFPYKNPITGEFLNVAQNDGGVENVSYELVVQMAKRGHEVFVFTSSIDSKNSIEKYENITIYRFKMTFTIGIAPISISLLYKPIISNIDLDIVHAHLGNLPAPLTAYLYSRVVKKVPFIVTYHGDWIGGFGGVSRRIGVCLFNKFICDFILSSADSIIGLSDHHILDSRFLRKYATKISVIPNGISVEEFKIALSKKECKKKLNLPIDNRIILFVGSLTPIKAPDVLLRAFRRVVDEVPDAYLVFVGDGYYRKELEKIAKQVNVHEMVKFVGYVGKNDDKKICYYYKSSDIFVLPSISEAFPLSLLEASASGLPLVGSELECFKAIIEDGYNGVFAKSNNEVDLANKIIYLLLNSGVRETMGENSRKKVKLFSWRQVAGKTEGLYYDFMEKFGVV